MLWLALSIVFAATRLARAEKVPAAGEGSRWTSAGTTRLAATGNMCGTEYPNALMLVKGSNATLTFEGSRITVNGIKMGGGGDVWVSVDNGPNLVFDSSSDQPVGTGTCQNFGDMNVGINEQHVLRVWVHPDQEGDVFFALLGADVTAAEDETIITDPGPSPTVPTSSSTTTTSSRTPIVPDGTTNTSNTVSSPTASTTDGAPPPSNGGGLATGAIVGIGITVPVSLALIAVFGFWFWRRRRDSKRSLDREKGAPTPFGVNVGGGGGVVGGETKTSAFLAAAHAASGAAGKEPLPYFPPADSTDPSSGTPHTTTTNKEALRAVYAARARDTPNRLLPALPTSSSTSPVTTTTSASHQRSLPPGAAPPSSSSPSSSSPPAAEPAMQELYQAMNAAGFTVNTLFDRLRRSESRYQPPSAAGSRRSRWGRRAAPEGTVVAGGPPTEPLPRYE